VDAAERIDALLDAERALNGPSPDRRRAARQEHVAPRVAGLEAWMRTERARLSRHAEVAKAMDYMLKRWDAFARFLGDGRICLTNNAAERSLRGVALGREAWLFAGSPRGGERAAAVRSLFVTAKLNGSTRGPGWPTCWPGSPLTRRGRGTTCCPGTGRRPAASTRRPDGGRDHARDDDRAHGGDARRGRRPAPGQVRRDGA